MRGVSIHMNTHNAHGTTFTLGHDGLMRASHADSYGKKCKSIRRCCLVTIMPAVSLRLGIHKISIIGFRVLVYRHHFHLEVITIMR